MMTSILEQTSLPLHLPFAKSIIRATIFHQFCGGETLSKTEKVIDKLEGLNTKTILDYGGEAGSKNLDFSKSAEQFIKAISFAAAKPSVFGISIKLTGLAPISLLEKISDNQTLSKKEQQAYESLLEKVHRISKTAAKHKVVVLIDAEESWIQKAIDDIVWILMRQYNTKEPIIFNTYQMYRHDRLAFIKESIQQAKKEKFLLGAKIVRGAYMDKERKRAKTLGYLSPIQVNKLATDKDFDAAVQLAFDHKENMATCIATHNEKSCQLMIKLLNEAQTIHPHISFCQLYGMSDHITFNLAKAGLLAAKYIPYGTINEVIPYLVRRAKENKSVSTEMSKEYQILKKEWNRRRTKQEKG
jgi:proline dehydrogenase